jgi:hypothetical protein
MRNAYGIFENLKKSLGRPMHREKDTIKRDVTRNDYECMDWIHVAQDRDQQ